MMVGEEEAEVCKMMNQRALMEAVEEAVAVMMILTKNNWSQRMLEEVVEVAKCEMIMMVRMRGEMVEEAAKNLNRTKRKMIQHL